MTAVGRSNPRSPLARRAITLAAPLLMAGTVLGTGAAHVSAGRASAFNSPGDILISDQFNNRVVEIDRDHHVVWSFGGGPNNLTASAILGVNDAQRVGSNTLLAGTGVPPGLEPGCPSGCADNRVMLIDRDGNVLW